MTLKELKEKRAETAQEIKSMAETIAQENREFSGEEQQKWDELNKTYDSYTNQVEIQKRAEEMDTQLEQRREQEDKEQRDKVGKEDGEGRTGEISGHEVRGLALQGWMRNGTNEGVERRHEQAAEQVGLDLNSNEIRMDLPIMPCQDLAEAQRQMQAIQESRAQGSVVGSEGGYTVPSTLLARFELAKLQFGSMMNAAEVMRTSTGEEMAWPSADDTSNKGEQVGENTDRSNEQDVSFDLTKWNSYPFSSKMIRVPFSLLRDSILNLESVLGRILGERIGRIMEQKFTTGNGASTPYGIVPASPVGKTTSGSTAITQTEPIDLFHSVDPAYRGNGSFMCNDAVIQYLRKLTDDQSRLIWQPGLRENEPDRLLGRQVIVNQEMASSISSGNKTMLFGDLSYYKIREVGQLRLRRLSERYAEYDQIAFIAFQDGDGNLLDAGTHPVKALEQA